MVETINEAMPISIAASSQAFQVSGAGCRVSSAVSTIEPPGAPKDAGLLPASQTQANCLQILMLLTLPTPPRAPGTDSSAFCRSHGRAWESPVSIISAYEESSLWGGKSPAPGSGRPAARQAHGACRREQHLGRRRQDACAPSMCKVDDRRLKICIKTVSRGAALLPSPERRERRIRPPGFAGNATNGGFVLQKPPGMP